MTELMAISISGGALIVAVLSWLASRRSAQAARRTADVAERNEVAAQAERDQRDAPDFEIVQARYLDDRVTAFLRLASEHPYPLDLVLDVPASSRVRGISANPGDSCDAMELHRTGIVPQRKFGLVIHIHPHPGEAGVKVTLRIRATETGGRHREWTTWRALEADQEITPKIVRFP